MSWPAYTVSMGVDGIWIAGGLYMPPTELRDHMRRYIGEHSSDLKKLERKSTKFAKTFGTLQGEAQKRPLADLKDIANTEPRVLNTQWVFWQDFNDKALFTEPKLDQFILDQWEIARPVMELMKDGVRAYVPSE